jgi:ribosome biogenesis GTPase
MAEGVITKALSGFYYVHGPDGICRCKARGKFRQVHLIPLVGDRVLFSVGSDGSGTVDAILPRRNQFVRPPVANIDVMVLFVSAVLPVTDPFLLDRMIFIAELSGCTIILCFNKCDMDIDQDLFTLYARAGFLVIRTSAESGEGIDVLRREITGKICAFSGNSGVGKSSVLNALEPNLHIPVGEVSERLGRGRHTTRHVEFFPLGDGTFVADTPGFSSFDIDLMNLQADTDAAAAFREFGPYLGQCRYADCAHLKEDGCAVRAAVDAGQISRSRYDSYVKIKEYLSTLKPWKK